MKHTLLLALLFLFTTGSFAQTQNKPQKPHDTQSNKQQKATLNPGNSVKHNDIKPVIEIGGKLYDVAKAEGRLAHYELVHKEGKIVSIVKTDYTKLSPQTSTLTPCDIVPPGTIPAFGSPVDDDTSPLINLPFNFCFYGNNYTQVRMSTNGNIQFPPTNNTAFSSVGFPAPNDIMIAPFWSDVDIRGAGSCTYDVFATYAVFSWMNVGYYNQQSDLLNDFQMVITDGLDPILPPGKNVGFYYGTMQWTTGGASSGVGGFPDPAVTPAIPATVGANAGNGIDYFLIGRFGQPGNAYDGPLGADDGVSWLDGKRFFFNGCPPIGANQEPLNLTGGYCDTLKICGNDTLYKKYTFSAPEVTQSVSITASAPTLGGAFSYSVLPSTNSTDVFMIIDGSLASGGYHTVTMTATDNGSPVLSSTQSFVVYVNQAALSNLSGSIVLTPTLGACPGGTVTASVSLTGGIPDGYLWSNNETTASTSYTTVVPADSLIFVTLTSGQCQKSIIGNISINPVPVVSISGNTSFCSGNASSTVLTATNTLNPATQGPHTYNWSGTGTIGSSNSASTTLTAGTYTVVVTNQFGCLSSATTTVVLNESPAFSVASSNAISGGSVYCISQDTARYGINFATSSAPNCGFALTNCISSNQIQIGSGTSSSSGTSYPCPYGNWYKNTRQQYLVTAAELLGQGMVAGKISSLSFIVNSIPGTFVGTLPNYKISLKCTSASALTSTFDNTGLFQVFNANYSPVVGVNTHNFTQSYVWDGVSNLLVDVCYDLMANYTTNPAVQFSTVGFTATNYYVSDSQVACGTTVAGTTSSDRPDMIFGNCLAQQSGTQFDVAITPSVGVVVPAAHDSIMFSLPSSPGTTCYTITLTNPMGGCLKDTVICIAATQGVTQATLNASSMVVCPSETITLSPTGAIDSYTISYTDVSGPQVSVNSPVTFTPSNTPGVFVYTLSATAPCGGPLTDFTTTVNVAQGVTQGTLTASQDSVCPGSSVILSPIGSLETYTIQYDDGSGVQSSVNSSVTIVPTGTTSPVFGIHTYSLIAQGFCGGPIDTFYVDVFVQQGLTQATLTPSQYSVCPGTSITLDAGTSLSTYTIQYDTGSGVQSSVNSSVTIVPTSTTSPVFGIHTYSVIGQGFCSAPIDTFFVDVFVQQGLTQATLTPSQYTVCPGSSITLELDPASALATYTIQYDTGSGVQSSVNSSVSIVPTNTISPAFGIHTYSVIGQGFCSAPIDTFFVDVTVIAGPTPTVSLIPTPSAICIGSPVTLSVTGTAYSTYTIAYIDGTGPHITSSQVTFVPNTSGIQTYSVLADGFCNSPQSAATATVDVAALANITIAPMPNVTKCLSGSTVLTANATSNVPGTVFTYSWTANGSAAVGTNTAQSYTSNATITTTYVVTVNGNCAAPSASSVVVTNFVNDLSVSIIDSAAVCANTELKLNATATGGVPDYTFDWALLPGTGSIGTGSELNTTSPGSEGTYTIAVVVSDSCGYTNMDMQLVTVLPPCDIVIPNIITPNGDGVNEAFKIKNLEYHPNTTLSIFDRWGRKVYESSNYNNDWRGDGLNDGTFFYILDVPDDKKYSGYLTIFKGN
jgi:gliding motility-associated-like protein